MVERLEIDLTDGPRGGVIGKMVPAENGRYVAHDDYQRLQSKLNEAKQKIAKLSDMLAADLEIVGYVEVKRERDDFRSRLDAAQKTCGLLAQESMRLTGRKLGDPIEAHVVREDGTLEPVTITVGLVETREQDDTYVSADPAVIEADKRRV
jgi:hypothetical protein